MKTKILASLKKTYIFLRSARVTIFAIIVLALLFLSGTLITQGIIFKGGPAEYHAWGAEHPLLFKLLELIQFTDIYSSPPTLFFLGLFFLNLLLVFIHRVPLVIEKCRVPYSPPFMVRDKGEGESPPPSLPHQGGGIKGAGRGMARHAPTVGAYGNTPLHLGTNISPQEAANKITAAFKKSGFRTVMAEEGTFHAIKNRFSPLGFLFFHASFFFCLLGGLMLFYTRFSGLAVLAEGQTFYNQAEQYYKIQRFPKTSRRATPLSFYISKIIPESQAFVPTGLKVQLYFLGPGTPSYKTVEINKPLKVGDDTVVVKTIGIAPLFMVRDFQGRQIESGYVYLNVLQGGEDTFSLSDKRYKMVARFYPDFYMHDGREATRSYEIKNPVFSLAIDKEGQRVWEGRLGPGETAEFFPFSLSFSDIKYWVEFQVVNERGDYIIFFGFFLGAVGLVLRFIFYRREIWGQLQSEEGQLILYLGGQSTFFPGQFQEEFKKVAGKIKESVK